MEMSENIGKNMGKNFTLKLQYSHLIFGYVIFFRKEIHMAYQLYKNIHIVLILGLLRFLVLLLILITELLLIILFTTKHYSIYYHIIVIVLISTNNLCFVMPKELSNIIS